MPTITLACSPDADDLFMMRALLEDAIDTGPYRFEIDSAPTDALNRLAAGRAAPDVIAISISHYPQIASSYLMLPHGGSMGEGYGPVVIARSPMTVAELTGCKVAVPGLTTTAWSVLRMMVEVEPVVTPITPYARIFDALRVGEVDAGLVIHEGRLTFEDEGFCQVADIGVWWAKETGGLPLPLGGNTIRRGLGEHIAPVSRLLRESIAHALEDREAAIGWLQARGGPLKTHARISQYLDMYANQRTLEYGEEGRRAIQILLDRVAAMNQREAIEVEFSV